MEIAARALRALAWLAAVSALASPAPAQSPAAVAHGRMLAAEVCAGCHALDGGEPREVGGVRVPSLRAIAGKPLQSAESLRSLITAPRHPMPALRLELSDVEDLVAYIRSLR
jgi:mono/diheme cytochrome c family protein